MRNPLSLILVALAIIIAGALLAWLLGAPVSAVIVLALAGAAAVVLVFAASPVSTRPARREPVTDPVVQPLHLRPDFNDLFDVLELPLLLVHSAQVRAANRSARALLGDFIVGADVRTAIRHPAAADRLANPRSHGAGGVTDLVGIGRPGQRWEMRTYPLADGSRLVGLTDQTARDAVERMRADFVANASHELRTPLAAIIGFVETLSDPEAGGDAATRQRFLGVLDKEARRMLRLVEDLLSISRIEASKGYLPDEVIDLAELIRDVAAEIAATTDPRGEDVALQLEGPAPVKADRAQLSQLLHNIIGNAMKYGRAATPIRVRLAPAGAQMVELSVADEGDGIPADALPRLTERFYRVDSARSRTLGGTGLGLAIVKHVVERHRGRLDIESREGEGTVVRVRLPLVRATPIGAAVSQAQGQA
jgi:two-component system phosphate regulon sensor histidine kinase PhoR